MRACSIRTEKQNKATPLLPSTFLKTRAPFSSTIVHPFLSQYLRIREYSLTYLHHQSENPTTSIPCVNKPLPPMPSTLLSHFGCRNLALMSLARISMSSPGVSMPSRGSSQRFGERYSSSSMRMNCNVLRHQQHRNLESASSSSA